MCVQRGHQSSWSRQGKIQKKIVVFSACTTRRQYLQEFAPEQVRPSMSYHCSVELSRRGKADQLTAISVCLRDNWLISFKNQKKRSISLGESAHASTCAHTWDSSQPYRESTSANASTAVELALSKWLHIWSHERSSAGQKFRAGREAPNSPAPRQGALALLYMMCPSPRMRYDHRIGIVFLARIVRQILKRRCGPWSCATRFTGSS